jgi:hypothetical protein
MILEQSMAPRGTGRCCKRAGSGLDERGRSEVRRFVSTSWPQRQLKAGRRKSGASQFREELKVHSNEMANLGPIWCQAPTMREIGVYCSEIKALRHIWCQVPDLLILKRRAMSRSLGAGSLNHNEPEHRLHRPLCQMLRPDNHIKGTSVA